MQRVFGHRPSPAMVVALLALFVSLSGSAYAALNLPKNSVGTRQLKKGAVTTAKLHNGAITASKVARNSLTGTQINASTLGTVPSAQTAATASNAENAASATTAAELGGQPPSAYAPSRLFGSPGSFIQQSTADPYCILGEIKLYAGEAPGGVVSADGRLLQISTNTALYSVIGTTYGGNGTTDFAVPDLRGAEPKGNGPHGVSYYICTQGTFP
jgi:hypothetical protein